MSLESARIVGRDSPLFREAVKCGNANEALRLGRNLLTHCSLVLQALGRHAAREGWASHVSLRQTPVNVQQVQHYQAISENVVLALRNMGITDIRQDMHEASESAASAGDQHDVALAVAAGTREHELAEIHRELLNVSNLVQVVAEEVKRADPYVDEFERRIDETGPRIDWSVDAILQHYAVDNPLNAGTISPGALICLVLVLCAAGMMLSL